MKKMKYCALALLAIASLASCDDELTDNVQMNVAVQTSDDVQTEGNVVTVKAGSPVVFNFTGNPDNIAFYSGEIGSEYKYRDRLFVDASDIESSTLSFKLLNQYCNKLPLYQNPVQILYSTEFPGLAKNDFKADSAAVEKFAWNTLVPEEELPTTILKADQKYEVDFTPYLGKEFTLAIHYQGKTNETNQSKFYFKEMKIVNKMKNGQEVTLNASSFGFTAINMMCHHNLSDQKNFWGDEYGTATNNTSGIWNLADMNNFFIHSSAVGTTLKNSWLVSKAMVTNSCSPDQGQAVKNIGQNISSYTHTYSKPGEYTATFIATNSNYKKESRVIRELTIKVVE